MAGLNFNDLRNKVSSSLHRGEDFSDEYENENEEAYDPSYDDQYESGQYDDAEYDDQYDDDQYEDEPYDDGQYDDGQYDDGQYDDGQYDDGMYDDGQYDDGMYDDAEYDDGYEQETADTLGYNPDLFDNLGSEGGYEDGYDEEGYDDQGYTDEYDEGEYPDDDYDDQETEPVGGLLGYVSENDWVMYAALIILPPLGIWLLWRKNKFDITLRGALSAASLIWFIIVLIWLFTRGGGSSDLTQPPVDFTNTEVPAVTTVVPSNEPTAEPSTEPTARVTDNVGTGTVGTTDGTYVYITSSGVYYHTDPTCGDMPNPSKVTLEVATTRGLTACPTCAGGTNPYTTTGSNDSTTTVTANSTFYATTGGTWYHVNPSCQGMTGASVVTEANAIRAGKTACPTCIGYFGTLGGTWYHNISNCQQMSNAITKTKEEWTTLGKTACPVCLGGSGTNSGNNTGSTPTQTTVYATADGKWYHTKSDCQGMKNATSGSISSAASMGKTACPKCVSTSTLYVFATTNGTYFHTKANCSGMKNPQYVTLKTAISNKKSACSECANMLAGLAGSTGGNAPTVNTTDTATYVYATTDGTYFHTDSTCSGMKNAQRITYEKAVSSGKKLCPTCVKTNALTVFCTTDGTYYHTNSTCSGMKNAVAVKASTAISNGKKACPTCALALASAGGSSNLISATAAPATVTDTYVYATADGTYFHTDSTCSGMKNAQRVTYAKAVANGKKVCPTCVKSATLSVFCTADGTYYHTNSTCSGMKNAVSLAASAAISAGKTACPVCAKALVSTSPTPTAPTAPVVNGVTVPTVNTTDTATYVYATTDGTYYHSNSTCSGMKNAQRVTYAKAVASGKKPCPTCIKSNAVTVFATTDGTYYHTDSTCSGMKNAVPVTASTAISYGKSACPTCATSLTANAVPTIAPTTVVVEPTTTVKAGITATSMVYVKPGTKYYHVASSCSSQGISGATNATLEYAIGHGYSACPSCNPPTSY